MNKHLLFVAMVLALNLVYFQEVYAQETYHLKIIDSSTSKGIENANITVENKVLYKTNRDGIAKISKEAFTNGNSIKISSIGYKSILINSIDVNSTISLSPSITPLKEVDIISSLPKFFTFESPKTFHNTPMCPDVNSECAQFIPNENKLSGIIASVEFELNNKLQGIEQPFNIEILSKSKDSIYPDTALFKDSIIVCNKKQERHFKVDISKYRITVPKNGFFIVFQILNQSYYNKGTVWYKGLEHYKTPGINIFLKEKDNFDGKCYKLDLPTDKKGFYSMLAGNRIANKGEKKNDWIVYANDINFAIKTTIQQ